MKDMQLLKALSEMQLKLKDLVSMRLYLSHLLTYYMAVQVPGWGGRS